MSVLTHNTVRHLGRFILTVTALSDPLKIPEMRPKITSFILKL